MDEKKLNDLGTKKSEEGSPDEPVSHEEILQEAFLGASSGVVPGEVIGHGV